MLPIRVKENDIFIEGTEEFIHVKSQDLILEHSLISISKWEANWGKPFLEKEEKTYEQTIDYIKCMTLNNNVDPNVYLVLTNKDIEKITNYIQKPMTATWFSEEEESSHSREVITSELIYYWMITLNIPVEFQKWHLNRLLTLIKVCNIKNAPPKKMSKGEIMKRNKALNEARKKKLNTRG